MARKPTAKELFETLTQRVVEITTSQQNHLQLLTTSLATMETQIHLLQEQAVKQHENIVSLSAQIDAK
jgi:hypothetical protein